MAVRKLSATPRRSAPTGSAAERLKKLGLATDADLVVHLPLRYEDETKITPIDATFPGGMVQIEAIVEDCQIQYRPRRQLVVRLADASGEVALRFLNFYGSQVKHFAPGARIRARGELRAGMIAREMIHPRYSVVSEETPLPIGLTPVYPAGEGVSQALLRTAIARALARADLSETLPEALVKRYHLMDFESAVRILHHPPVAVAPSELEERTHPAWRRIKFDELLAQQLTLRRARLARRERSAPPLISGGQLVGRFLAGLPFQLTGAQERVWHEISADLEHDFPMQRLLQGDVGCGKTVIAALAALRTVDNGYQAALMAPTEILAEQHFRKLAETVEALGVRTTWLTGSLKRRDKRVALEDLESGESQLAIGTHALIQEGVTFRKLGLAIVDEQHRFGVGQRLALRAKLAAGQPHQLMMSATPIPRTLAMTYYADLEISTIDQFPPGRKPVVTRVFAESRRSEVLERIHTAVTQGEQAYWVCPLVEESEVLELQTAVDTYAVLCAALPDVRVGLVHGRLAPGEKAEVMKAFVAGSIQLLVATTVIEVGVDVANASLMVIEHAERFGLAQLHQLRGRIGRGRAESTCILLYQSPVSGAAKERLETLRRTHDGFEIARRDLELRGPGEFLGERQSGDALLRFADLRADQDLVVEAQDAANWLLRDYADSAQRHLARWMAGREEFLKT